MTLALSLEHALLVPQGAGSDQLINDVHTIVYLVCLIVLLSKESCGKEYVNCHHAIITVVHLSVRHPPLAVDSSLSVSGRRVGILHCSTPDAENLQLEYFGLLR